MIVVDASTLVMALVDQGAPEALARERTATADMHVPHLTDVEVVAALARLAVTLLAARHLTNH